MFAARILGWTFLILAILMACAEGIATLGTGSYVGLANSEVLSIMTGLVPEDHDFMASKIMICPAWTTIGCLGAILLLTFRKKVRKTSFSK
ncbi:MAG: hypothetical protein MJ247_00185 [Alphaproteobacteria bacterium]|nr:hypothetical protein [Alphaproteobacteria bacterium]